jgi:hypothetical protein
MRHLFRRSIKETLALLESQLEAVKASGLVSVNVSVISLYIERDFYLNRTFQKVVLTGGFSESPSLRYYIQHYLDRHVSKYGKIKLIIPSVE